MRSKILHNNILRVLRDIFKDKRYLLLAIAVGAVYTALFVYAGVISLGLTTNDYLLNFAAVALNIAVIVAASVLFTVAAYYLMKTARLKAISGGVSSTISSAVSTMVVCSCNISLIVPLLSFIGLGAASIAGISAVLLNYHLGIQGLILGMNISAVLLYSKKLIREGFCKTCTSI